MKSSISLLIFMVVGAYAAHLGVVHDTADQVDEMKGLINKYDGSDPLPSNDVTTSQPSLLQRLLDKIPKLPVKRHIEEAKSIGYQIAGDIKGKGLRSLNNLLQLGSVPDSGFFTNRLEPAGFLGGNGLLANKGGLLGRPGALVSTGSAYTDYPTAYRRK